MNITKSLLTFLFFTLPVAFFAQTTDDIQHKIDSLQIEIKQQKGEELLDTYVELVILRTACYPFDKNMELLDEFRHEAEKQKRKLYIACAHFNKLILLYNHGKNKDFEKEYPELTGFLIKNEFWEYLYELAYVYISLLEEQKRYDEALSLALGYYKDAQRRKDAYGIGASALHLGMIYTMQLRYDEALKYLDESIALLKQAEAMDSNMLMYAYNFNICTLIEYERYEECLPLIAEMETYVDDIDEVFRNKVDGLYLQVYVGLKEYDLAWFYMEKLEPYVQLAPLSMLGVFFSKVTLLEESGRYREALELLETLQDAYTKNGYIEMLLDNTLPKKAHIARLLGEFEIAINTHEQIHHLRDSLNLVEVNAKVDELRTKYEVEKHIEEKERNRNYFILTVIICAILAAALITWINYSRRVTLKNRGLVRQIQEQDRLAEELERERAEKLQLHKLLQSNGDETAEENEDELFLKLQKLMKEDKLYTDSGLTRKETANRLGTNEKYLQESVKRNTGITFQEYIASLRLAHARELLVTQGGKLTGDAIAAESGFGSRATLYRLFREHYGLTPEEFKKLARQK